VAGARFLGCDSQGEINEPGLLKMNDEPLSAECSRCSDDTTRRRGATYERTLKATRDGENGSSSAHGMDERTLHEAGCGSDINRPTNGASDAPRRKPALDASGGA